MFDRNNANVHFLALVSSIAHASLMHMGKITNPVTGKLERDLNQAKSSIDILEMLKDKTKGNLTEAEEKIINENVANLQLNYAEEVKSDQDKKN